jgi:hypothetical protein
LPAAEPYSKQAALQRTHDIMHQLVPEIFPAPSELELEIEALEIRSFQRQQRRPYI